MTNWLQTQPALLRLKSALRPVYHSLQEAYLHRSLAPNAALRNKHVGETCFILGTGVSLRHLDLSALAGRYTLTCNEIFHHPQFSLLNPTYYTVVEPYYGRVLGRKYLADVYGLYSDIDRAFRDSDTEFIFHATLRHYLKRHELLTNKTVYYVLPRRRPAAGDLWRNDLTRPMTFSDGAIFTMIGAALYMGFTQLYLLGCGYTYEPAQLFHFYDYPRIPSSASKDERLQFVEAFQALHPAERILGWRDDSDEAVLSVCRGEPNGSYLELHRGIDMFAKSQGARIVNVVPEEFASPAYAGISPADFAAVLPTIVTQASNGSSCVKGPA